MSFFLKYGICEDTKNMFTFGLSYLYKNMYPKYLKHEI